MTWHLGGGRDQSRPSEAVKPAKDAHEDRLTLSFTLLLVGLLAVFASTLTFAVPHPALHDQSTDQP